MTDAAYIPISVATLAPSTMMGMDLYHREENSHEVVLYRGGEFPLEASDLDRLRERGISRLFIEKHSRDEYQQYLRTIAEDSESIGVSNAARVEAMNEVVLDVLENAFANSDTDETVAAVKQLGLMTSEVVSRDGFAAGDLCRVLHHDYATFTHSANVAFYAAMLASELGYSKEDIEHIAVGGLLHDLGKLEIPEKILCKPGKLDDHEFRQIKRHPTTGFRLLAKREDLSDSQLMMVYQHHERDDGRGYPVGCHADDIHPWAKICSVVDVYEAVTSHRPYRTPMPRTKALEILQRDAGVALDKEMVECWTTIISRTIPSSPSK